jgi:hypothetical protein
MHGNTNKKKVFFVVVVEVTAVERHDSTTVFVCG